MRIYYSFIILVVFLASLLAMPVFADDGTWNARSDGYWNGSGTNRWLDSIIPGSTSSTTNTDKATFSYPLTTYSITVAVDTGRNIKYIDFDYTSSNAARYVLSGGSLFLTDGGVIRTLQDNGDHIDTITTPVVIQGDGGAATFTAGASSAASVLNIGAVRGVATSGNTTTLTLDGSNTGTNTMAGVIGDGSGGGKLAVVKSGDGTWILSGVNTYTGGLTLMEGTLLAVNNSALGSGGTLNLNGGTFASSSSTSRTVFNNSVVGGDFALGQVANPAGAITLSGAMDLGGIARGITIDNTSDTISGVISNGGITKLGGGMLRLSGVNNYAGVTTISEGTLSVGTIGNGGVAGNLGAATSDAANLVFDGGTLQAGTVVTSTDRNFTINDGKTATFNITANSLTLSGAAAATTGSLTKTGNGTLVLAGANLYAGETDLMTGKTTVSHALALGTAAGGTSVADGASLQLSGGITVAGETLTLNGDRASSCNLWNLSGDNIWGGDIIITKTSGASDYSTVGVNSIGTTSGSITITGNVTASAGVNPGDAKTLALNSNGSTRPVNISGNISDGDASNPLKILIAGGGITRLSGSNSYTGPTTLGSVEINGATLEVYGGDAIGDVSAVQFYNTTGSSTRLLELKNADEIVGSIATSGTLTGPAIKLNAYTLTAGGDNTSTTFSGVISGAGGSLVKAGTGTLTLSGTNAYTGGTTISAGTLSVAASSALGLEGNAVTIGPGASLRATESFTTSRATTLGGTGGGVGGSIEVDSGKTVSYTSGSVISGDGSLIKTGAGTLSLGGTGTYTGDTYLQEGTLVVTNGYAIGPQPDPGSGAYAVHFSDGATLRIAVSGWDSWRQSEGISGSASIDVTNGFTLQCNGLHYGAGELVFNGTGTTILTNANIYTGGTKVETGVLQVNNAAGSATGTGDVVVTNGGTLSGLPTAHGAFEGITGSLSGTVEVENTGTLLTRSGGTLTLGGLTLNTGSRSTFQLGSLTAADLIDITGNDLFTLAGASTVEIVNTGSMAAGTYHLFDYTGTAFSDIANLSLASAHAGSFHLSLVNNTGNTSIDLLVDAITNQWKKGGVNTDWSTTGNWWTGDVPDGVGADAQFINNDDEPGFGAAETSTIDASKTVGSIVLNNTGTAFTIAAASGQTLTLDESAGDAVIQVLSAPNTANHVISAPVVLADDLTVDVAAGSYGLVISGAVSGADKDLTKTGSGPLTLSGAAANTYTGLTEVTGGSLYLNKTAGIDAIGSGGLRIDDGATAALLASDQIADGATVTVNGTFALGAHAETISRLEGGGSVTTGTGGVLTLSSAADTSFIGTISGTGGVAKAGAGTLTLAGTNSYSGGTTISAGVLSIGADAHLGDASGTVTFDGGALLFLGDMMLTRPVRFEGAGTLDAYGSCVGVMGAVSGDGTLTKSGIGRVGLGGANTAYDGDILVESGILRVINNDSLGSAEGGTAVYTGAILEIYGNGITIGEPLTLAGGGVHNMSGINTVSGAMTLTADAVVEVTADTLVISGAVAQSGGSYGLAKTGSGTVELTNINAYTGRTDVQEGTLAISGSGSIASSTIINLASGAHFDATGLAGAFLLADGQTLSGPGTVLGDIVIGTGSTLSPGNSPGTQVVSGGSETWEGGGTYLWQVLNPLGAAGIDWDLVSLISAATLDITATPLSQFTITIEGLVSFGPDVVGDPAGFDPAGDYSWMIVSGAGGTITGFGADKFAFTVSGISGVDPSDFSVSLSGGNMMLNYTGGGTVPEPATVVGLIIAALGVAARKIRRGRRHQSLT